jgi:hypothetical protein
MGFFCRIPNQLHRIVEYGRRPLVGGNAFLVQEALKTLDQALGGLQDQPR